MSMEIAAVASVGAAAPAGIGGPAATPAGYNASLSDLGGFSNALADASARMQPGASQGVQQLVKPLEHINAEANQISADARAAQASGKEMTPGEIVGLTVRCQEFMFHCQLTSNIANRTSDGLQQLFRQQS
jgi:hypothetical protein